jgi:hypothetical protein
MFKHILRKKKIILDCFTTESQVFDYCKIKSGKQQLPDWWKNTPKDSPPTSGQDGQDWNVPSIRACKGIKDYYDTSIMFPLWTDFSLELLHDGSENLYRWNSVDPKFDTNGSHHKVGTENFCKSDGFTLKFTSPWLFKCNSDVNFLMSQPTWHDRALTDNLVVLPGVLNFKYQHGTNINFFLRNYTHSRTINIPAFTPLAMFHPLTEDKVVVQNHLIDESEEKRLYGDLSIFKLNKTNSFYKLYNRRKKLYDDSDEIKIKTLHSSCPFKSK